MLSKKIKIIIILVIVAIVISVLIYVNNKKKSAARLAAAQPATVKNKMMEKYKATPRGDVKAKSEVIPRSAMVAQLDEPTV